MSAPRIETVAGSIIARSDAQATAAMMDPLLEALNRVVGARNVALHGPERLDHSDSSVPKQYERTHLDGGVEAAFDSAVIRILDRIEALASRESLWNPRRRRVQEATDYDVTTRLQKLRAAASAADALRPSVRFGRSIELVVLSDGRSQVQMRVPGGAVVGIGSTFNEALADFDSAFERPSITISSASEKPPENESSESGGQNPPA